MNISAHYLKQKGLVYCLNAASLGAQGSYQATIGLGCSAHHRSLLPRAEAREQKNAQLGSALCFLPFPPAAAVSDNCMQPVCSRLLNIHQMLASFKHAMTINPESRRYMRVQRERKREGKEGSTSFNFRNLETKLGAPHILYIKARNYFQRKLIFW